MKTIIAPKNIHTKEYKLMHTRGHDYTIHNIHMHTLSSVEKGIVEHMLVVAVSTLI